jgi:hypothetical protein
MQDSFALMYGKQTVGRIPPHPSPPPDGPWTQREQSAGPPRCTAQLDLGTPSPRGRSLASPGSSAAAQRRFATLPGSPGKEERRFEIDALHGDIPEPEMLMLIQVDVRQAEGVEEKQMWNRSSLDTPGTIEEGKDACPKLEFPRLSDEDGTWSRDVFSSVAVPVRAPEPSRHQDVSLCSVVILGLLSPVLGERVHLLADVIPQK